MQKIILVDATKCTGCRTCELVCSVRNERIANPARSRVHIIRFDSIMLEVPMLCQQCVSAPCIAICPVKAISLDKESGVVNVNYDLCIGCKVCMVICPFGGIGFDPVGKKIFKCDQCGGDPTCVKFCETKALQYVDVTVITLRKAREYAQKLSKVAREFARE